MSHLITLFEQHSYLILFIGIFLELVALPISGEFLMSYAGYFIFQGKMDYSLALLTAFIAGASGTTITYWIGKLGGYKLIEKYGKYIHLGPERYKKVSSWYERSGSKLLIFAYFIPGIRHFTGYISGISKMSFVKFIFPAYIGSFLWGFCFITLGKVLGPRWDSFHQSASKYLIVFIIIFAILVIGYFAFKVYKVQIKNFFIHFINWLSNRLKIFRKTEIFLIFNSVVLIGMVTLMLGMAQDYLFNEFTQFDEITAYIVKTSLYMSWMKGLLVFQSPYVLGVIIGITIFQIWKNKRNRILEYSLLSVSILGTRLYHESVIRIFSYLQTFGFVSNNNYSENFPDINTTTIIIIIGTCVFLLIRHSKNKYISISVFLLGLIVLIGLTITNIATADLLPSDIMGGYVYGSVWILFNFLLFEMLRLLIEN